MYLINNILKERFTKSLSIKERYQFTNKEDFRNKILYALDKITITLFLYVEDLDPYFVMIYSLNRIFGDIKVEYFAKLKI